MRISTLKQTLPLLVILLGGLLNSPAMAQVTCPDDTLLYIDRKNALAAAPNNAQLNLLAINTPQNGIDGMYQYYNGPQQMQITGVEFFAYIDTNIAQTSSVNVSIFNANPTDSTPMGAPLGGAVEPVDTGQGNAFKQVNFPNPITVNGSYLIVIEPANPNLRVTTVITDPNTNAGMGERLAGVRFSAAGTWDNLLDASGGGIDADFVVRPYVQYSLNPSFTASPNPTAPGTAVNFTPTLDPIIFDRMYNLAAGIDSTGFSHVWSFGDGSPTDTNRTPSHTYSNTGEFGAVLQEIVFNMNGNAQCAVNDTDTITVECNYSITIANKLDVQCNGDSTGQYFLDITGSSGPFSYNINGGPTQTSNSTTIMNRPAGTDVIAVTDANGCQDTAMVTINEPSAITLNLSSTSVSCGGSADGTATVSASGGTSPYSYSWNTNPAQSGTTATGLSEGYASVTVTDDNGCSMTDSVFVNDANNINPSVVGDSSFCQGDSLMLYVSSNNFDSVRWNNGMMTDTIWVSSDGNAYVEAFLDGCSGLSDTLSVSINDTLTPMLQMNGDTLRVVNATGGMNFEFFRDGNSVQFGTADFLANPANGTYRVVVTDGNGCEGTSGVLSITGLSPLSNARFESLIAPNPSTGRIRLELSGLNARNIGLQVTDITGRTVLRRKPDVQNGQLRTELNLSDQPSGLYILKLQLEGRAFQKKLLIQR